jgi:hypothetical protein
MFSTSTPLAIGISKNFREQKHVLRGGCVSWKKLQVRSIPIWLKL